MMQIDANKPLKDLNVMSIEQEQRANRMLPKSTQMLDEQIDEVKEMNKRALIGKVTAIRDKQLMENRELED